ncbi:ArsR family transcriptional regulator [Spongiactinospora gelatinilytica]|uniref:ArsR family transcriptional regulator n=1 Tax=Spongiactinospora gelatinilytica TaxID=2666298 RepID=A0A2W2I3I9_9ACTN|nr:MarR family transcriptional regulator [Spongiactinospora gelatinilytica]PZG56668.1 ArsR family transcriptional regulator [Spongiactinospora gelatinilytica]
MVEYDAELVKRARVHAALGEPARLAIIERLAVSDASPSELGALIGLPANLLAHHVTTLQDAGLIERRPSEGDRRRTYLRLTTSTLTAPLLSQTYYAPRVLFICTHNSARSQLAAALWDSKGLVPAVSAGTIPAERVHPRAIAVAQRHGLSMDKASTAHMDDVLGPGDLLITVCDNVHEQLRGQGRLHWSIPDPVPIDDDAAFDSAFADIADRIDRLAPVVRLRHKDSDA